MLHHGLRSVWWIVGLFWQSNSHPKCDNEQAILALVQEIRRLRKEGTITIFEHPEEGEKQRNHLVQGGVNIASEP